MDIIGGHNYLCIRDVIMNGGTGKHEFIKGKIYHSVWDGKLTNESGDRYHGIYDYPSDAFASEHFVEVVSTEDLLKEVTANLAV